MTYLIPLTSTKHDRAIRFGRELERAMKARGVGSHTIAEPLHASRGSIMYWRTGRMLPRIETARRLAELFVDRNELLPARPKPRNGYRTPGADSARMSRVWAGYSPQEAAARKARASEAMRRARGLVAAEVAP